ncbi:hypothetical protein OG792_13060 [Micromonospora sp. NBC_01699]|uniref:hypothetical protein n=1 Tax=Micromonospora sp. NBC_01699 TaxID=2975984 RepID=UPI002E34FCC5|nr:hypothetical protein [Micromonospora sp. NBC_01699]
MEHDPDDGDPMGAPHRPGDDWHCKDDAEEWPCQVFRRRMWSLYQGNRPRLAEVMGGFRDKATATLPDLTPEQAEARFVGWVHDPPVRRRLRAV